MNVIFAVIANDLIITSSLTRQDAMAQALIIMEDRQPERIDIATVDITSAIPLITLHRKYTAAGALDCEFQWH